MTLGEFERRFGVNKGTVSKAAWAAGFETSKGLSSEAVQAMKRELNVSAIVKAEPQELPATPASTEIQVFDPLAGYQAPEFLDLNLQVVSRQEQIDAGNARIQQFVGTGNAIQGQFVQAMLEAARQEGTQIGVAIAEQRVAAMQAAELAHTQQLAAAKGVAASPKSQDAG